jgi:GPH family glycoside/pentoside/hexuronide:cation symporter
VRSDLGDLVRNRPWMILFSLGACTLIYLSFRQVTTVYYFAYYVGDKGLTANFFLAGTFCSILGAILTPFFVKLGGDKRQTFIGLTAFGLLCNGATWFAGPQDHTLIFVTHMLAAVPQAAIFPLMGAMYADAADYGEWKFGRRATGLVFAGSTFANKTGGAIGSALVNIVLSLIGYQANVAQSATSLNGLRHLMSTLPAAGAFLVIVLTFLYPLNREREQQIAAELLARKPVNPA